MHKNELEAPTLVTITYIHRQVLSQPYSLSQLPYDPCSTLRSYCPEHHCMDSSQLICIGSMATVAGIWLIPNYVIERCLALLGPQSHIKVDSVGRSQATFIKPSTISTLSPRLSSPPRWALYSTVFHLILRISACFRRHVVCSVACWQPLAACLYPLASAIVVNRSEQ